MTLRVLFLHRNQTKTKHIAPTLMAYSVQKVDNPVPVSDLLSRDLWVVIDFQLVAVHSSWNILQCQRVKIKQSGGTCLSHFPERR